MQMSIWQEDLFSVACYICARTKLHATSLAEEYDPNQPSWGWMVKLFNYYLSIFVGVGAGGGGHGGPYLTQLGLDCVISIYLSSQEWEPAEAGMEDPNQPSWGWMM